MEINKNYQPADTENKWYQHWKNQGYFQSKPDQREPYTIVIPPPNVTGILHMGHMLNNTLQDVLIRRKRMQGYNACWVPGTDHASIATEAKVVALLSEKGISKKDLSREEFLKHAWECTDKYGGIILKQLEKLGCSCDWNRTRFTLEENLSDAVIQVFVDLYEKGLIYRGVRMVNWDPKGLTAVSDEEVIRKEINGKLFYVNYPIAGENQTWITVATTRPETILGDSGIAVHPNDERYQHLIGKKAIVPFIHREIPIIADENIDISFGTGCLKVTPAHDLLDYEIGIKHNLEIINTLNEDGTIAPIAGRYIGEDRFVARKKMAADLATEGLLVKTEDIVHSVGFSERTDAVIEPRLSQQWFVNMKSISGKAKEAVENDVVNLIPNKFKNTYRHWMENIKDWCISRQLWWGHRIPAYYLPNGNTIVAITPELALSKAQQLFPDLNLSANDLQQDEDVLDTWFSSWLWPISVFDGFKDPNNPDIKYYYPTNDLITAPEILFFWVARMIMAGYEYRQAPPFKNVYLTGIVRDKLGRKMSKSLGNSPDPIELIDKYSADGVRFGMLICSPAGNDLLFDESYCEQGRNFANKIWNAFRLIHSWQEMDCPIDPVQQLAIQWMGAKIANTTIELQDHFNKFRISEAQMVIYKLIWDDFCSWFLEMIKPPQGHGLSHELLIKIQHIFESLLQLLHPFMPFLTEEIWHLLSPRKEGEDLMVSQLRTLTVKSENKPLLVFFPHIQQAITELRSLRNQHQISPKQTLQLWINPLNLQEYTPGIIALIQKMGNFSPIEFTIEKINGATYKLIDQDEFYILLESVIDPEIEKQKLTEELNYQEGFLISVRKKLENEKFRLNAKPEIIAAEEKKQQDSESRIRVIKDRLKEL